MDGGFVTKPLERRGIDQAFPVLRTVQPDLELGRWRAFATALLDPKAGGTEPGARRCGIMTVRNGHGYIHGLFSYAAVESLRRGRILAVDNLVVLDLFNAAEVADALLRAMDALARALGCRAIHASLPEGESAAATGRPGAVLDCFRGKGYAVETLRLCRILDGANDNVSHPLDGVRDGE